MGFSSLEEYQNSLNSLSNLIFTDEELNKPGLVNNQSPYLKATHYSSQIGRSGVPVKHVMGELYSLGSDINVIYTNTKDRSPLYRTCLRLCQIDLVLFVAEEL
jgi:hypothetical protein